MAKEADNRDATLKYIDQVQISITDNGQTTNRITILLLLSSFIVIALSSGIASTDQKFSFGGLSFITPSWLLLIGGSYLVSALFIYSLCLLYFGRALVKIIRRLYYSIEFRDESLESKGNVVSIYSPNLVEIMLHARSNQKSIYKIAYTLGSFLVIIGWLLFPILAEIAACYRMIVLFGFTWWVLLLFSLMLFISLGYLFGYLHRTDPIISASLTRQKMEK